jgi:hypothetical protein
MNKLSAKYRIPNELVESIIEFVPKHPLYNIIQPHIDEWRRDNTWVTDGPFNAFHDMHLREGYGTNKCRCLYPWTLNIKVHQRMFKRTFNVDLTFEQIIRLRKTEYYQIDFDTEQYLEDNIRGYKESSSYN